MLIGTTQRLLKCGNSNIDFIGIQIEFVKQAKLLGFYIDNFIMGCLCGVCFNENYQKTCCPEESELFYVMKCSFKGV
jgi:hypothetical protein